MLTMRLLNKGLLIVLLLIFQTANGESAQKTDAVLVIKSEKRLYLMNKGEPFASLPHCPLSLVLSLSDTSKREAMDEHRKGITC